MVLSLGVHPSVGQQCGGACLVCLFADGSRILLLSFVCLEGVGIFPTISLFLSLSLSWAAVWWCLSGLLICRWFQNFAALFCMSRRSGYLPNYLSLSLSLS